MSLPVRHYNSLGTAGWESVCVESYLPNTDCSVTVKPHTHTHTLLPRGEYSSGGLSQNCNMCNLSTL